MSTPYLHSRGFSLIEIVAAIGVFLILGAGVTFLATGSFSTFMGGGDVATKERFARDAVQTLQIIQERSWTSIDENDNGDPATESNSVRIDRDADGTWVISSGSETRDGLTRYIYISAVQRDGSATIVTSGGTDDPSTKKVVVVVRSTGYADYTLETFISNTDAYRISQTSWNGAASTELWTDGWENWYEHTNMDVPSSTGHLDLDMTEGGSACVNTGILTWWRMEGSTHSTGDYPDSTTAWTLTNTTLSDTAEKLGTYGLLQDGDGHRATLASTAGDRLSGTAGRAGMWVYVNSLPSTGYVYMFRVRESSSRQFHVSLKSNGTIQVIWYYSVTELLATSSSSLSTGQWYWMEVEWDAGVGDGSDVFRVYVDGSATGWVDISNETMTPMADTNVIWVGSDDPYNSMSLFVDHLIISSDPDTDLSLCQNTESYPT